MSSGFPQIGAHSGTGTFNAIFDALALRSGHQLGYGVISGLTISGSEDALEVTIQPGVFGGLKAITLSAPLVAVVPDDTEGYLWLDEDFATTTTLDLTSPGGTFGCVGGFQSVAGAVSVNANGRCELGRWIGNQFVIGAGDLRVTPGEGVESQQQIVSLTAISAPRLTLPVVEDAPDAVVGVAQVYSKVDTDSGQAELFIRDDAGADIQLTVGGRVRLEDPAIVGPVRVPMLEATATATVVGSDNDPNLVKITPSGADRKYLAPPTADLQVSRTVLNAAATGGPNLIVRNSADSATLATLAPGESVSLAPTYDPGTSTPAYKTTYTPRSVGDSLAEYNDA